MNKLWLLFTSMLLISCGRSSEEKTASVKIDSLEREITALQAANDTLSEHLLQKSYATRNYPEYFDSIPEPEKFLLKNLQEQPALIPDDAVLGGTMHFISVKFINDELLLAEYEDGHIMGKAVYSYKMDKNGDLQFEMIGTID